MLIAEPFEIPSKWMRHWFGLFRVASISTNLQIILILQSSLNVTLPMQITHLCLCIYTLYGRLKYSLLIRHPQYLFRVNWIYLCVAGDMGTGIPSGWHHRLHHFSHKRACWIPWLWVEGQSPVWPSSFMWTSSADYYRGTGYCSFESSDLIHIESFGFSFVVLNCTV